MSVIASNVIASTSATLNTINTMNNNEENKNEDKESTDSTITITLEPLKTKPNYLKLYKTLPWYVTAHIIVYIVIYNVYYPNDERLHFLRLDTGHLVEVYRFFTHVFLHANASHLTANIIIIAALTFMCGTAWHTQQWRIILLYSLGVLQGASGVGWEKRINRPNDRLIGIGASGAAYGMLGVNLSDVVFNWSAMPLRWFRLFIVCAAIVGEIVSWYYVYEDSVTVSGHIGGFIGGVLGGPLLLLDARSAPDLFAKSYYRMVRYYKNKKRIVKVLTDSELPSVHRRQDELDAQKENASELHEERQAAREAVLEEKQNDMQHVKFSIKKTILFGLSAVLYPLYTVAGIINYFTLDV